MPIVLNGSGTVTGLSQLPDSAMAAGSILQVVQTVKSDTTSVASASFTDLSGMTVSITPTSSNSKVVIMCHMTLCNTTNNFTAIFKLVRGSTAICVGDADGNKLQATGAMAQVGDGDHPFTVSFQFMDSPSTTSATTYKIQLATESGQTCQLNRRTLYEANDTAPKNARYASTLTAMEVAA